MTNPPANLDCFVTRRSCATKKAKLGARRRWTNIRSVTAHLKRLGRVQPPWSRARYRKAHSLLHSPFAPFLSVFPLFSLFFSCLSPAFPCSPAPPSMLCSSIMRASILCPLLAVLAQAGSATSFASAPVVTDSVPGTGFVATFPSPKSSVQGSVIAQAAANSQGVDYKVSLSGLPVTGGPFRKLPRRRRGPCVLRAAC